jgi:hypothetical protein
MFQKEGSGKEQLNWLLVYVQPVIVIAIAIVVVALVAVVNSNSSSSSKGDSGDDKRDVYIFTSHLLVLLFWKI